MNFAKGELMKLKIQTRFWLFIQLPLPKALQLFHLAFAISDKKVHAILISTKELPHSELSIEYIAWVDTDKIFEIAIKNEHTESVDHLALQSDQLRILYSYCLARSTYLSIERQLIAKSIQYAPMTSKNNIKCNIFDLVPNMMVSTKDLLQSDDKISNLFKSSSVIRALDWWKSSVVNDGCRVQILMKLKNRSPIISNMLKGNQSQEGVTFNFKQNFIEITTFNVKNCLMVLIEQLKAFIKIMTISNELQKPNNTFKMHILQNNNKQLTTRYSDKYTLTLYWNKNSCRLNVLFGVIDNAIGINPHYKFTDEINRILNTFESISNNFFHKLSYLLNNSITLLNELDNWKNKIIVDYTKPTLIKIKINKKNENNVIQIRLNGSSKIIIEDFVRCLRKKIDPLVFSRINQSEIKFWDGLIKECLDKLPTECDLIENGILMSNVQSGIKALQIILNKLT